MIICTAKGVSTASAAKISASKASPSQPPALKTRSSFIPDPPSARPHRQTGKGRCREGCCQYVWTWGAAEPLNKKKRQNTGSSMQRYENSNNKDIERQYN